METIIQRIERLMFEKKLKDKDLCDLLNVSQSTYSTWKAEGRNPKSEYISKIAQFLNVSERYLLTGESDILKADEMTKEVLEKKGGLYFKFAQTANELDLSEDDLDYIIETYKLHKKHIDKE